MFTKNFKKISFCVFALALALNCFNCNKALATMNDSTTTTTTINQTHHDALTFCKSVTGMNHVEMKTNEELKKTILDYCLPIIEAEKPHSSN